MGRVATSNGAGAAPLLVLQIGSARGQGSAHSPPHCSAWLCTVDGRSLRVRQGPGNHHILGVEGLSFDTEILHPIKVYQLI